MSYRSQQRALTMRDQLQEQRDARDAARAQTLKTCKDCGEAKPWTQEYWYRKNVRRADGTSYLGAWNPICRECGSRRLREIHQQTKHLKKERRAAVPPVAKALGGMALPAVPLHQPRDFRGTLIAVVAPEWRQIAHQLVKLAKSGDKQAIRLITSYVLGTPRELEDDSGAHGFWSAVMAAASQSNPGPDPDRVGEAGDLVDADGPSG